MRWEWTRGGGLDATGEPVSHLVLSLFPGIGLLDMAFDLEGFCVVRGPDLLWGGDVRRFHPPAGRFDGVIGGPPCQLFSTAQQLAKLKPGHVEPLNLIPEFERVVREACPRWFVMENVRGAPLPTVPGYHVRSQLLNNRWLGEVQNRVRRFSFGCHLADADGDFSFDADMVALDAVDYAPAVLASGSQWIPGSKHTSRRGGGVWGFKTEKFFREARALQGLPESWDLPGFTVREKIRAIGNGVPLPMGRAVARAVKRALGLQLEEAA